MKEIERRVVKLENCLGSSLEPETLEEMFAALERGDYGKTNLPAIVFSIMSHGGSADHLKGGEIPDMLIDFLDEHLKNTMGNPEVGGSG